MEQRVNEALAASCGSDLSMKSLPVSSEFCSWSEQNSHCPIWTLLIPSKAAKAPNPFYGLVLEDGCLQHLQDTLRVSDGVVMHETDADDAIGRGFLDRAES